MRIFNLIPDLSGGGAERQLTSLAPELVRMGHEIHIAYSQKHRQLPDLPGVQLHQLQVKSNYDPALLRQLFRLIHNVKPDIIHTWILQMDIVGGILAKLSGIPWVFREPSSAMAYPLTWKNQLRVVVGYGASAVVSNSKGGDEYWKNKLPDSRRYIVPNGLPLWQIASVPAAMPVDMVDPEIPIVLYVGRFTESKNLKLFLEALLHLYKTQPVLGVLCGEGPQRIELEALAEKLRITKSIAFVGQLSAASVWALMKKSSVFVSFSAFEGCPNAVMEAMACGCPVVVSDIPAHREILDETTALFVNPTDTKSAAVAIVQALSDKDAAGKRALLAQGKTRQWDISGVAQSWERVYKAVV